MKLLVKIVNHKSYLLLSVLLVGGVSYLLVRNGFQMTDLVLLVTLMAVDFGVWQLLHTRQLAELDSVQVYDSLLQADARPTVVEFFSTTCAGCIALKPVVDRLEAEVGDRLQVIRLNIEEEPGRTLVREYGVLFTPTFIYFDAAGKKVRESVGFLDRARILYDLEDA